MAKGVLELNLRQSYAVKVMPILERTLSEIWHKILFNVTQF